MADSSHIDWLDQWQALSRQGLAAWQEIARSGEAAHSSPEWAGWPGLQRAPLFCANSGAHNETAERLLEGAKNYAAFMQSMLAASAGNAQGGSGPSWTEALRQGLAAMGGDTGLFEHPAVRAWRAMPGQGGEGFAHMMGALNALRSPPPDTADLKAWMNLPAFGLHREQQEHAQKTATAWLEYQEQMRRYSALMLEAAQRGFARFEAKLAEHEEPGRQIESMRALYDLWVDAAEEGYAEIALSPEFREVYGALVNAQMRVRSQTQHEIQRVATDLGMPTRSEINSIGERLQALRREVRARAADASVTDELTRLRDEFAALKASFVRTGKAGATAARTPASARSTRKPRGVAKAAAQPTKKRGVKSAPTAAKSAAAHAAGFSSRIGKFATTSTGSTRAPAKKRVAPKRPKR